MLIYHDNNYEIIINKKFFFNSYVMALFELSIAAEFLCRLGNPMINDDITINIEGIMPDEATKKIFEKLISDFIMSRTCVRYNCIVKAPYVNINCKIISLFKNDTEKNISNKNECILLYSQGLDSKLSYYILQKEYNVQKLSFNENSILNVNPNYKSIINCIPNKTFCDSFDNDPWGYYCQYFIYLTLALNHALFNKITNVSIGLNKDDLWGYDIISEKVIYSQCSQSYEFIDAFEKICNKFNVKLILPLRNYNRLDICIMLLKNDIQLSDSISCVFYDNIECGMCFSCFDKITGLLVAASRLKLSNYILLRKETDFFELSIKGKMIMKFNNQLNNFETNEKMAMDYIMTILLNRILMGEDLKYIKSSKYSISNIIEMLLYYNNTSIATMLFPRANKIFSDNTRYFINVNSYIKDDNKIVSDDLCIPQMHKMFINKAKIIFKPLTREYSKEDYFIIVNNRKHLKGLLGHLDNWFPSDSLTEYENNQILSWHEDQFNEKKSFAYAILKDNKYIGNIYIYGYKEIESIIQEVNKDTIYVFMWTTEEEYINGNDALIFKNLQKWLYDVWKFKKVEYPGRTIPIISVRYDTANWILRHNGSEK